MSIFLDNESGVIDVNVLDKNIAPLTTPLETKLGLKRSFVSPWLDRFKDVFKTSFDLEDNHKVVTITILAKNNHSVGVGTFFPKASIANSPAGIPDPLHASNDCHPAIGTPIKFTKSFPAKANAKENVPIIMINLYMF